MLSSIVVNNICSVNTLMLRYLKWTKYYVMVISVDPDLQNAESDLGLPSLQTFPFRIQSIKFIIQVIPFSNK